MGEVGAAIKALGQYVWTSCERTYLSGIYVGRNGETKDRAPFPGLGKASTEMAVDEAYFACALRAAMSASLRSVITPILLSR